MKKNWFILAFILLFSGTCFAQEKASPALLIELNRGVAFFTRAKVQYKTHRLDFNLEMPYMETIPGKAEQVKMLRELVTKLGGKLDELDESKFAVDSVSHVDEAMLLDASEEIGAIAFCNLLKYKFNHPEVNKVIEQIKDQSLYYYMLYDNIAQLSVMARVHAMGRSGPPRDGPEPTIHGQRLYEDDGQRFE